MSPAAKDDSGWSLETALDTEWSHAIAPKAKILVVEAASDSGTNLLKAVDYARGRAGVVAISMSWGGGEFAGEAALDPHFTFSKHVNRLLCLVWRRWYRGKLARGIAERDRCRRHVIVAFKQRKGSFGDFRKSMGVDLAVE